MGGRMASVPYLAVFFSNIRVVQGVEMEKQVADLIRAMPKWEPGRRNGKPIKVNYTLPININLQ